jgi:hypothetical protein
MCILKQEKSLGYKNPPSFAEDGGLKIEYALLVIVRVSLFFSTLACPLPPP